MQNQAPTQTTSTQSWFGTSLTSTLGGAPIDYSSGAPSRQWDDQTRLSGDRCAVAARDKVSTDIKDYRLETAGLRSCETQSQYAVHMSEPAHYQAVYHSPCYVVAESELLHAPLTNPRVKNQLFQRPYLGAYSGAGQRSLQNTDLESGLIYGNSTRTQKPCGDISEASIDRFQCLPEYGNPQRVQHIVEPWIRGGDATRDYVRRVNYEAHCLNSKNGDIVRGRNTQHGFH